MNLAQAGVRSVGHDDHPGMDAEWRNKLLVCSATPGENPVVPDISVTVTRSTEPRRVVYIGTEIGYRTAAQP